MSQRYEISKEKKALELKDEINTLGKQRGWLQAGGESERTGTKTRKYEVSANNRQKPGTGEMLNQMKEGMTQASGAGNLPELLWYS